MKAQNNFLNIFETATLAEFDVKVIDCNLLRVPIFLFIILFQTLLDACPYAKLESTN